MSIGSGIAIAGIWAAVAAICYADPIVALLVSGLALFATAAIVARND